MGITTPVAFVPPRVKPLKSTHLPSLDGIRAVSIVFVLFGHLDGTRNFGTLPDTLGDIAHLGVLVFFVISGFLITSLLLREDEQNGRVSLKLFYARRALRIFPASYAYILFMSALWLAGIIHLASRDLWHAITYTVNYERQSSWQIGHLWSLSVEEQFYFLWPFAFIATRPSRRILVVCSVILMAPVARLGAAIFLRNTSYRDMAMFPMVADSLAAGCLLALIRPWLERRQWYLRIFQPAWAISLLGMIFLANHFEKYSIVSVAGTSLMNLSLAILIHRSVFQPRDWIGRVLNWKPVAWLGGISYSLYLWQQVFINRNSDAWINAFPQNLVLAVLAALGSWLLLEKPLLKMRHRLRARASV